MTGDLAEPPPRSFAFGSFVLIPERQLLLRGKAPIRIGGRALEILTALAERPGELVSKRELIARVWPNIIVDEGNLKVNMAALRRALGDGVGTPQYIATVTGRGYRFVAPVQLSGSSGFASPSPGETARGHNLPIATTRVFGRADAIEAIRRDLESSRIVTVVGPGGIGKTTVALAAAERALGSIRDGVWLVDLAPLKDPALAPNAIATAIGLVMHSADALTTLIENLRDREMLVVLDSCEHIIEAAALCADRILAQAPGVRILATSREPLRIKGERIRRLPGLSLPPASSVLSADEALAFPAIQLFVERATDGHEAFSLSDAQAPSAADICRKLDGLALAIELAATRVHAFGIEGLLSRLDDRLRLLSGRRAGPERHRTLTATLDWSYGLLSPGEAGLLRGLSVFPGVFGLAGASAVVDVSPAEAAVALAELFAKSLLVIDLEGDGIAYRLSDTTRAYCVGKLQASGEYPAACQRHAEYVCAVLERATSEWSQRPSREWGTAYRHIIDDLRQALAWLGTDPAHQSLRIRLTVAGGVLWNHFSLTEECRVHTMHAVAQLDAAGLADTTIEMQLQVTLAGAIMFTLGPTRAVGTALDRALSIATRTGDTDCRLRCLRLISVHELLTGRHEAGIRTLETFASVALAADPASLPDGETIIACAEIFVGRLDSALQRLGHLEKHDLQDRNSVQIARFGYFRNTTIGNNLSHVQWLLGLPETAARTAEANVAVGAETQHDISYSGTLAYASLLFFIDRRFEECARHVATLGHLVRQRGIVNWRPLALFLRSALALERGDGGGADMEQLERAVEEFRAIGHLARMPLYLSVVADHLARHGRHDDAERTVQIARDCAEAQSEIWCLPEVLRVRAAILVGRGDVEGAAASLGKSMEVAQRMGALSWRLRSANDLARLWRAQGRTGEVPGMLRPIYDAFTEGFTTRDLMAAAGLLAIP